MIITRRTRYNARSLLPGLAFLISGAMALYVLFLTTRTAFAGDCISAGDCQSVADNANLATGIGAGMVGIAIGVAIFTVVRTRSRVPIEQLAREVIDKDATAEVGRPGKVQAGAAISYDVPDTELHTPGLEGEPGEELPANEGVFRAGQQQPQGPGGGRGPAPGQQPEAGTPDAGDGSGEGDFIPATESYTLEAPLWLGGFYTPEQWEVIALARKAKITGLATPQAQALIDRARRLGLPVATPEGGISRPHPGILYMNIGPVEDIPVSAPRSS